MNHLIKYILIVAILFPAISSIGQSNFHNSKAIHGKVFDDSTGYGIAFANIYNESNRTWEYSSERGEFTVWANIGDTIVFSSVGYLSILVFVNDTMFSKNVNIPLVRRTYQINEVTVIALKNYSQFKQELVNMDIKKSAIDSVTEGLSMYAEEPVKQAVQEKKEKDLMAREKGTILTLTKAIPTRAQKENRMYIEALERQRQQDIIDKKYNRQVVYELTGLEGDELTDFIAFCAFEAEYLLENIAYDICEKIKEKYIEYEEIKNNPINSILQE